MKLSPPPKKTWQDDFRKNSDKVDPWDTVSPSYEKIGRTHALNDGVDAVKRINVFLEIDKGVAGIRLTVEGKVQIKASTGTVFEFKSDHRHPPHGHVQYTPSGFQNDCVGVSEENFDNTGHSGWPERALLASFFLGFFVSVPPSVVQVSRLMGQKDQVRDVPSSYLTKGSDVD